MLKTVLTNTLEIAYKVAGDPIEISSWVRVRILRTVIQESRMGLPGIQAVFGCMMVVTGVLLVRFGLGPLSYAAGTPGGLFAPMLVLGSQSSLVLGTFFCRSFPYLAERPAAFAVVGMAAFFTAVVRAPVTGIVLLTEMTGCFTLLLPMLLA
jgi:H+/Cl- antiporter ClcA